MHSNADFLKFYIILSFDHLLFVFLRHDSLKINAIVVMKGSLEGMCYLLTFSNFFGLTVTFFPNKLCPVFTASPSCYLSSYVDLLQ